MVSSSSKPNAKEFEISFDVKAWMIPDVKVMVYYVHQTGEVVYDIVDVASDENLPNEVNLINLVVRTFCIFNFEYFSCQLI